MSDKQETVIPNDYCIMKLKVAEGDITEIGITKVRNNNPITVYVTDIEPINSLEQVVSRALEIIGADATYCLNAETDIELFKSKCESLQIPITNELLSGNKVIRDIGVSKKNFICNVLEVATKI